MSKVMSIITALAVGLACAGAVSAKSGAASQPGMKHAKMIGPMVDYKKLTGLTDKQTADIKAINKQAKLDAGKVQTAEEKHSIWKAADEKIRTTVLTADQRQQLNQLEQAKVAKHQKAPSSQPTGAKYHQH